MDQEAVHLKERVAADLEAVVINWRGYPSEASVVKRGTRNAVHDIHLYICFIGEELNGSGGLSGLHLAQWSH